MHRRILSIALFTGTAQILGIIAAKLVTNNIGKEAMADIGLANGRIGLIAAIVSFGVQLSVNRNAASQLGWRSNFKLAQSARFTISLFLFAYGIISYLYSPELIQLLWCAAPLVAMNGNYALYGNGKPVEASQLAFFRTFIPYALLIFALYFASDAYFTAYLVGIPIGIFVVGFFASRINEVDYFHGLTKKFFKIYSKNYKVGLYQISAPFLISSILEIANLFYDKGVLGLIALIIIIYEVFKGGLRIINQAFFRELKSTSFGLRVDKIGVLIGLFMLIPTLFYTREILNLLDANEYVEGTEIILIIYGISMFIASVNISTPTQILLKKKDNANLIGFLGAGALAIILTFAFSYLENNFIGVPLAVLCGEVFLLIILGFSLDGVQFFAKRFGFMIKSLPILGISILPWVFFNQSIWSLISSVAIYALLVLIIYRKLIFDTSQIGKL